MHFSRIVASLLGLTLLGPVSTSPLPDVEARPPPAHPQYQVIILGGGVAGVIAAQSLHRQGIDDFVIVEAREELGGRLTSHSFGGKVIELGANWIQGTQSGSGPENPILKLARRHGLQTQASDFDSMTTYDVNGPEDYLEVFNRSGEAYTNLTIAGGLRVNSSLVDLTARTGYLIQRTSAHTLHEEASEYYRFDWEYAQTPEQTSWIASSWANNFTFVPEAGGFSDEDLLSIDQRGFKHFLQAEASSFLKPHQVRYSSLVKKVTYGDHGVAVALDNGEIILGDYAICTFSIGVLQHEDVDFEPQLPDLVHKDYKFEAINSMTMATYTKIFLQFPEKFWFDTEVYETPLLSS
ncbi:hypothetical protein AAF712_001587 [Marasmius tenuissimus]|uniref:Amine oxidase domain-containing protein n=1 Tax=Marasmius tenuissimus TaxID=585030 RepID=A0ABR3ACH0_9AGAR